MAVDAEMWMCVESFALKPHPFMSPEDWRALLESEAIDLLWDPDHPPNPVHSFKAAAMRYFEAYRPGWRPRIGAWVRSSRTGRFHCIDGHYHGEVRIGNITIGITIMDHPHNIPFYYFTLAYTPALLSEVPAYYHFGQKLLKALTRG
jgi:hypothetical protein